MAAVATPCDHNSVAINIRLLFEPAQHGFDIFVGSLSFESIVHFDVILPVTCRAAHIGENNPNPQLVQKVIVAALIDRAGLPFGTAMNIDDDWTLARKF